MGPYTCGLYNRHKSHLLKRAGLKSKLRGSLTKLAKRLKLTFLTKLSSLNFAESFFFIQLGIFFIELFVYCQQSTRSSHM